MNTMRIVTGVLAMATLAVASGRAQERGVHLGLMAGGSVSTLAGTDIGATKSKYGLAAGGYLRFDLSRNLGIETGALYAQRGAKYEDLNASIRLSYLEIPLLLSARFPNNTNVTPFMSAGPALSFKLGCGQSAINGGTLTGTDCAAVESDIAAQIKSTDPGLVGTIGFDIQKVRIAVRYYYGLTTIDKVDPPYTIKNRDLSVMVGYNFPLSKGGH